MANPLDVVPAADRHAAGVRVNALLESAGLVRSPRRKAASRSREGRIETAARAELVRPAFVPRLAANGVRWLPVPGWELPWLWSGFSTRVGGRSRAYCAEDAPGELNLGFTADDDRAAVAANRRLLAEAVTGDASTPLITIGQFHSNLLVRAGAKDAARERPRKADGLICGEAGILIGVQTADCIPVLVADPRRRAVGAFHAGWRGTVKRIVETGVGRMQLEFGSRPADLIAAIGPGIGPCCYAVGEEVLSEFESQFPYARELFREVYDSDPVRQRYPMLFMNQCPPGHGQGSSCLHADLIEANRRQLLACGIPAASIQIVGGCTQCNPDLFFSHRGSGGSTGRMMGIIGLRRETGENPTLEHQGKDRSWGSCFDRGKDAYSGSRITVVRRHTRLVAFSSGKRHLFTALKEST
jgi:polyphenol oxidase